MSALEKRLRRPLGIALFLAVSFSGSRGSTPSSTTDPSSSRSRWGDRATRRPSAPTSSSGRSTSCSCGVCCPRRRAEAWRRSSARGHDGDATMRALVVDLGGSHATCAVVEGRAILSRETVSLEGSRGLAAALPLLADALRRAATGARSATDACAGLWRWRSATVAWTSGRRGRCPWCTPGTRSSPWSEGV